METIISYIDNLFRNYPDTLQLQKARDELLGIMEDKYHELKAEGKSENEAIGIVISEFGSMEEIAADLGLDPKSSAANADALDLEEEKNLTLAQAQEYVKAQETFGLKIAAGVALCILSPIPACIMNALEEGGFLLHRIGDAVGGISMFLIVAVAVGFFILGGFANQRYEEFKKKHLLLDVAAQTALSQEFEDYSHTFGKMVSGGIILCIVSVIPVILFDSLFSYTSLHWISELSGASLFALVAAGVFLLIFAGVKHSAYELLLKNKTAASLREKKKKDRRISILASIYWPIITAVYLTVSFFTMQWGMTWIIWPVSGLIFGSISAVVSLTQEKDPHNMRQ